MHGKFKRIDGGPEEQLTKKMSLHDFTPSTYQISHSSIHNRALKEIYTAEFFGVYSSIVKQGDKRQWESLSNDIHSRFPDKATHTK